MSRVTRGNFVSHHDTHPVIFSVVLTDKFGADWVEWEPEVLREEIEREFRHTVSTINWDIIQAVRTLLSTESPWENWVAFTAVSSALNNNIVDFHSLQQPTPAQLANTVEIFNLLNDDNSFSDEVIKFMAACCLHEDLVLVPEQLSFVQDAVSQPRYRCEACDWVGDSRGEDTRCWHCGSPKVTLFLTHDPEPVRKRLEELKPQLQDHAPFQVLDERDEDIQIARLLMIAGYTSHRKRQLKEQLEEFGHDTR